MGGCSGSSPSTSTLAFAVAATARRRWCSPRRRRAVAALGGVALNVFGGNEVARNLYRSLGYAEAAVFMHKPVEAGS